MDHHAKPRILVFCPFYVPGWKAGGPVRSIAGLVASLGDEFDFFIICADRDPGDKRPYAGIRSHNWNAVGKAQVYYLRPYSTWLELRRSVIHVQCNAYYINGLLYRRLSIEPMLLRWAGVLPRLPVALAPRGELGAGALSQKPLKKSFFTRTLVRSRVYEDVIWQASSDEELADIARSFPSATVRVAGNLASLPEFPEWYRKKDVGSARFLSVARIDRMKNLIFAMRILDDLGSDVSLDIIGPTTDAGYLEECKLAASKLKHVRVQFLGELTPDAVHRKLADYHALILPTLGENFGHAILEALCAGCLVLISNRTPWRDLVQLKVGWDISLDDQNGWRSAARSIVTMGEREFGEWSRRARLAGTARRNDQAVIDSNRQLLSELVSSACGS